MSGIPDGDVHRASEELAERAGHLLLELRRDRAGHSDPRLLGREADRQAHELLARELAAAFPDDALLSEEGRDDRRRLSAERVWIVDPLDGTREFTERGRSDWGVHVALWCRGELVAGAVALPAVAETYSTARPAPVRPDRAGPPRVVVSRTRPPAVAARVRDALDGELLPLGSAGAKAMAVLRGDADVYVHAGGQYEWDSAAPVVVATAAGLHASRLDGSALTYNQPDPYMPDLLICRPELAARVLEAVTS